MNLKKSLDHSELLREYFLNACLIALVLEQCENSGGPCSEVGATSTSRQVADSASAAGESGPNLVLADH